MEPQIKEKVNKLIDSIPQINPIVAAIAKTIAATGGNPTRFLVSALSAEETVKAEQKHPKPSLPTDYTETERIIHDMLVENTGVHLLDSGSIYGRYWQKNRKIVDFRKLPVVEVEVSDDGIESLSINIFHYLRAFLERDDVSEKLEQEFYEYAEGKDGSWLRLMIDFAHSLKERGWEYGGSWNSYNWDNLLSQVVQGVSLLSPDRQEYVILQIHGGCDVRGGYTAPRFFKLVEEAGGDFFFLMSDLSASCDCTSCYTDDAGYHWYNYDGNGVEFPEYWKPRDGKLICQKCLKKVEFHNLIEDYL